jgi:hypothetical protein
MLLPTTSIVRIASPADHRAPQKLADQEIARPARPARTAGPCVEGRTALCTAHTPPHPCTFLHNPPPAACPYAVGNPNKSLLFTRNWLRSAKPSTNTPSCAHPSHLNRTLRRAAHPLRVETPTQIVSPSMHTNDKRKPAAHQPPYN